MATAVAIDTARLALEYIPYAQKELDSATGGQGRFQIHRVSVHATIPLRESEFLRQWNSMFHYIGKYEVVMPKQEALDWQADPDDDLSGAAVLHHLHQQAATVRLLSSVISQSDHGNASTSLTGSALSASINAATHGRHLSSFHSYSVRQSCAGFWVPTFQGGVVLKQSNLTALFPSGFDIERFRLNFCYNHLARKSYDFIVWAGPLKHTQVVFWQLQLDVIDLFSRRNLPNSRPGKRRRTAFNQFLQVSDSPLVEDTSRGNPLPRARRFNGVRHRPDRKIWVAEMKPPKHKTKQDFGNFKLKDEAARTVDAAFYHYGRPDLLNFPNTSLQFLSTRPPAPPGLDEKAKVKFVKEEARLLLAATFPLHSTPTDSLQIQELSASPRRCPSGQSLSLSEISWPLSCSGLDEGDTADSQPQQWVDLDSIYDISIIGVQSNLETVNSEQNAENSSTLAASPHVINPSACEIQSMWLDSLIRLPPAPMYSRSPSPSRSEDEIAYALLKQQSI